MRKKRLNQPDWRMPSALILPVRMTILERRIYQPMQRLPRLDSKVNDATVKTH